MFRPGERFHRITNRSEPSYGRGLNSSAFATLKMEVFAPIPIARDNTAASANPGFFTKERRAKRDRKSTRLNSSHTVISYAVFCLKKKKHAVNQSAALKTHG